jgi:hypothetical protein
MSTTVSSPTPSSVLRHRQALCDPDLFTRYRDLCGDTGLGRPASYRKVRLLGRGGQGAVYLAERRGCDERLLHLCRRLVAADPSRRFASALTADLGRRGAVDFHRHLVKEDLASEYDNDIRVWLEQLG